ncbi:Uncharacterised protein [Staphylococcus aureus]|nr:Uncharacterised protein [Staphylococcus aureus]CAA5334361.1 Uncharacterised protein [Staphylococcus aureus]SBE88027.1 Uncharacterised protein [Staphylococcus aureus]SCU51015.1 Uncharacterised protein [Staphylococcus aureus]
MSGPESNLFVLKSILTTTITKPSSDNSLRSLITTLPISPIPLPSTSTLPDGMRPALRAESCVKAKTSPISKMKTLSSSTPHSTPVSPCAFNIRYSP